MRIENTGGTPNYMEISVDDTSYRYRTIMGENELTLYFSIPGYADILPGAYIDFEGQRYTLLSPQNFKKHGTRNFEYTLILESVQSLLKKYKFRDTGSGRLKFTLTARPEEHLAMLVENLNQRSAGWTAGNCITATEKVVQYNHDNCMDALKMLAETFETEYEIEGQTIHMVKVEYNKENPLPLSYGRGNGFKPGVGRSNVQNSRPIEKLYVQGGVRNIDKSKYGSSELKLPRSQELTYQGVVYETDADGFFIKRANTPLSTFEEDSIDLSHIYPSRIGVVTEVLIIDAEKHKYDFCDQTIPSNLDFEEQLTAGQKMTVIFQTGQLTGKEFDVKFEKTDRLLPPNRFEIAAQEVDGFVMPGVGYMPAIGDEYAIFGVTLPDQYVCDNENQVGASWQLFSEGARYLYENGEQRFFFSGELDGIFANANWIDIAPKIRLGGFVEFSDPQFQNGVLVRISGIKDFINDPHRPIIDLSNLTVKGNVTSRLHKVVEQEVEQERLTEDALDKLRRRIDYIIDFSDDRLRANEIVRTESFDPRMLAYDAGTPQFSIRGGEVETNRNGDPNSLYIAPGEFINHHAHALDRDEIEELRQLNEPYIPEREWDIIATTLTMPDNDGHFLYIKVPLTYPPPLTEE